MSGANPSPNPEGMPLFDIQIPIPHLFGFWESVEVLELSSVAFTMGVYIHIIEGIQQDAVLPRDRVSAKAGNEASGKE